MCEGSNVWHGGQGPERLHGCRVERVAGLRRERRHVIRRERRVELRVQRVVGRRVRGALLPRERQRVRDAEERRRDLLRAEPLCLGDVAGRDLPSPSRDARILSMLLLLRDLTADQMKPMHIIAENQEDRTLFFMCFSHFRRLVFVTLKWMNFYQ